MKRQQTIQVITAFALTAAFAFGATHPASAVQFAVTTCTLAAPTPCVGGTNTSTGPGIQGISNLGFGNVGQTRFNSTSSSNGKAGILGQDLSTSGSNDEGVRGTSVRGLGVHGISSSRAGVRGDGTSSQGVFGSSSSNAGVQGVSATGNGVVGQSTNTSGSAAGGSFTASGFGAGVNGSAAKAGTGGAFSSTSGVGAFGVGNIGVEGTDHGASTNDVIFANGIGGRLFRANNSSGVDVFTLDNTGRITSAGPITVGSASTGTGLLGFAFSSGVHGVVTGTPGGFKAGVVGDNTSDATTTAVYANGFGGFLFVGNNSGGSNVFTVDNAGNLFVSGNVSAHSYSTHLAPTTMQRTSTGAEVTTYASQAAAPTIEDIGEARLTGGTAYVPLKQSFGSAIDHNQTYMVFITPQGPVRGAVYVAQKDARGFTVREAGGASNVAFDYRIVGKPYVAHTGVPAQLPAMTGKKQLMPPTIHKETKRFNGAPIPASIPIRPQ